LQDLCDNIAVVLDIKALQSTSLSEYSRRIQEQIESNNSKLLIAIDNLEELHDTDKNSIHDFLNGIGIHSQIKVVVTDVKSVGDICLRELAEEDRLQIIDNLLPDLDSGFRQELSKLCRGIPLAIDYAAKLLAIGKSQELVLRMLRNPQGDLLKYCFESITETIHKDNPISFMLLMAISVSSEGLTKKHLFYIAGVNHFPQEDQERAFDLIFTTTLIHQNNDFYTVIPLNRIYLSSILESIEEGKFKAGIHNLFIQCYTIFAKEYAGDSVGNYHESFDKIKKEWGNFSDVLDLCQTYNRYEDAKILWRELIDFTNLYGYWGSHILQSQWLIEEALMKEETELTFAVEVEVNRSWIMILKGGNDNLCSAKKNLEGVWETCDTKGCDLDLRTNIAVDLISLHVRLLDIKEATYWDGECQKLVNLEMFNDNNNNVQKKKAFLRYLIYAGDLYSKKREFKNAEKKYLEARRLSDSSKWMRFEVKAAERLAHLYICEDKNLFNAEQLLNFYYQRDKSNYRRQAFFERDFSELMLKKKRNDEAREYALKASKKFQDLGMIDRVEQMNALVNKISQQQENTYSQISTKSSVRESDTPQKVLQLVILYAPEDGDYRNRIITFLAQLEKEKLINIWTEQDITPGDHRDNIFSKKLEDAKLILLLISSDFFNGYNSYIEKAIELHKSNDARVIPILLRPCFWENSLSSLETLPKSELTYVSRFTDKDEAFLNIVNGIRDVCQSIIDRRC
jgi:hypothetical protein